MTKIQDIIKTLDADQVLFDRVTVKCIIQFVDGTVMNLKDFRNLTANSAIHLCHFIEVMKDWKIPCRPTPFPVDSIVVSIINPMTNKVMIRSEEPVDLDMDYKKFFYTVTGTGRILEENCERFRTMKEYYISLMNKAFDSYSSLINICQTTLLIKLIEERKR